MGRRGSRGKLPLRLYGVSFAIRSLLQWVNAVLRRDRQAAGPLIA